MRNEQPIRQHKLVQILERARYGRTLAELTHELVEQLGLSKLSERTVRRDLEALQAVGFDIDSHPSERGAVWKLSKPEQSAAQVSASLSELLALAMGRELLTPLRGTPYWQGIETLWQKLMESVPQPLAEHFEKQRKGHFVHGTPAKTYDDKQGVLANLNRAITQHRVVRIEYHSLTAPEPQEREIEPYGVVLHQGSLYVVAAAREAPPAEAMRHLKLDRFAKATVLDQRFKPQKDFDPEQHFADSLGMFDGRAATEFQIRIAARVSRLVLEDPWHPDQQTEVLPSGDTLLSLRAPQREVIPRVLALGIDAEILTPAECRTQLAAVAAQLAEMYEQSEPV